MMKLSRNMMDKAVEAKIITDKQAQNLIEFLKNIPDQKPGFTLTNVLYYFGGLIAIGAMSLFMNLGWELYGGWGIFFLCIGYAILGLGLAQRFSEKNFYIPAGICATFVICLTPLAIYGLQKGMGWWPDVSTYSQYNYFIKWQWIFMELSTLAVGVVLAWIYRYPFMIMPIAVTLWYISMDLTSIINNGDYSFELGAMVSMYFGLFIILIAFLVDIKSSKFADYAFWLYIFGVLAFWSGLTSQDSGGELSKFLYFGINLVLILIGVILNRKVFVVFGAIGSSIYIGYLSFEVFKNSYLFPFVLTVIGVAIIYLGILWQKNEANLSKQMRSILPLALKDLLEARDHKD